MKKNGSTRRLFDQRDKWGVVMVKLLTCYMDLLRFHFPCLPCFAFKSMKYGRMSRKSYLPSPLFRSYFCLLCTRLHQKCEPPVPFGEKQSFEKVIFARNPPFIFSIIIFVFWCWGWFGKEV